VIQGVQLRRERRLGELLSDSFTIYFARWQQLVAVVAPAVLVSIAGSLISLGVEDSEVWTIVVALAVLPFYFIAYQLVSAAVIALLTGSEGGRTISAGDALDQAQDRFGDVVPASLRATAIVVLLTITIVGLPWAIYRAVRWLLIIQSIMVDGQTSQTALDYSAALVTGRWWLTAGRMFVSALVIGLPTAILSGAILEVIPGVGGVILSDCTAFFAYPYGIIFTTLLFFDYKTRRSRDDSTSFA
jgi:hypothetical protein